MTLQGKKRLLLLLAVVFVAMAAGVVAWGLSDPFLPHVSQGKNRSALPHHSRRPESNLLSASDFQTLWDKRLRRPLYDPPPPPPKVVVKQALPPLRVKLLATMIEATGSQAMLQMNDGSVIFKKMGEKVNNTTPEATITEIKPGTVTIQRADETLTLSTEQGG